MITPLDGDSARKLSAGQVITNLSSVLKELVENSLDAGARTVTIRVEDHGMGSITVEDDGSGIDLSHLLDTEGRLREGACLPLLASRATTKQREPEGTLTSCAQQTLGFRGEALHCLAHLSELSITTMSEATRPTALSITYNASLCRTNVTVTRERRDVGTTVVVSKLFAALPVRLKDFTRGKKKQLLAAVLLMKQYSLSHPHVRLLMTHRTTSESAPVTLVSLTGTNDLQRALAEAYGGRVLAGMERVEWGLAFGTITGYVSKVTAGRLSSDVQLFALDGRLVDLPAMAKAVNDAYAECLPNAAQRTFPAFFLHVNSGEALPYDVNLVPNKRKVLITEEEKHAGEVRLRALRTFQASTDGIDVDIRNRGGIVQVTGWGTSTMSTRSSVSTTAIDCFMYRRPAASQSDGSCGSAEVPQLCSPVGFGQPDSGGSFCGQVSSTDATTLSCNRAVSVESVSSATSLEPIIEHLVSFGPAVKRERENSSLDEWDGESAEAEENESGTEVQGEEGVEEADDVPVTYLTDEANPLRPSGPRSFVKFPSLAALAREPLTHSFTEWATPPQAPVGTHDRAFSSLTKQSEKELTLYLEKSSFKDMIIHGQFNHGFIVASLNDDIFVIDQHAADEKGNYERLISQYVAKPQPLVSPVAVFMEPQAVELAFDRCEDLREHGFIVRPCDDANKLMVLSVPVIPYEVVQPHDVMELIKQLLCFGAITKPMRCVWHSMATKACRSSIMIGTVLSEKTMRSVVGRLGDLEQPWTCPHGRPTLRHVAKISSLISVMMKARCA